ncbi:MAG TPA: monovalent cation/H+ antiporter complex subunit F [Egibacteraceae bacterium]
MTLLLTCCVGGVALAALLCAAKAVIADTVADRIVALDMLLGVVTCGIAVGAVATRDPVLLNLLVVTALLGFVGTVTVARFMERRGL